MKNMLKAMLLDVFAYYKHRRSGEFVSFVATYFQTLASEEEEVYRESVLRLAHGYNGVFVARKLFNKIADLWENTQTLVLPASKAKLVQDFLNQLEQNEEERRVEH